MRLRIAHRTPFAVAGMMLLSLVPSAVAAASGARLFTGGGYSRTAEGAIQQAIWDAENSAASEQLYTCELAGEPEVFPRPNDPYGRVFSAEATVACTP